MLNKYNNIIEKKEQYHVFFILCGRRGCVPTETIDRRNRHFIVGNKKKKEKTEENDRHPLIEK